MKYSAKCPVSSHEEAIFAHSDNNNKKNYSRHMAQLILCWFLKQDKIKELWPTREWSLSIKRLFNGNKILYYLMV